ncbi:trimeric LpxA-like protein [Limtongia smithiae]|uniref:trimeric LpxA-like protein n=1 Tax=Limtongia smithiae TaxID=1125753 RepID=UPI0034CDC777
MARLEKDEKLIAYAKTLNNVPLCDDYEKMISGMRYNSFVAPLLEDRNRARRLVTHYNTYYPEGDADAVLAERETLVRGILGKAGKNVYVEPPFFVDYGCNISIGDDFYSNFNATILDCSLVTIGDRVLFGPNVSILSATHDTDVQARRNGVEYALPITIGSDCWLGGNVTVLPGVTIGRGCTIGAGSVVARDIPPFSVAVGVPAKVVKKLDEVPEI